MSLEMTMSSSIISTNVIPADIAVEVEKRIDSLSAGALPYYTSLFKRMSLANCKNAEILCDFLTAEYNRRTLNTIRN